MKRLTKAALSMGLCALILAGCASKEEPEPKEPILITPDEYMAQMQEQVVNRTPSLATENMFGTDYGTIEKVSYYSTTLEKDRNVNVLLPAGYDEDERYPVLYILHG